MEPSVLKCCDNGTISFFVDPIVVPLGISTEEPRLSIMSERT